MFLCNQCVDETNYWIEFLLPSYEQCERCHNIAPCGNFNEGDVVYVVYKTELDEVTKDTP